MLRRPAPCEHDATPRSTGKQTRVKSLSSLIRLARPDDALAAALEAMIERSDLILSVRDGDGRFVQTSRRIGERLGSEGDGLGRNRVEGRRFFDGSGREIALVEHPAQIARISGRPQLDRTIGILAENGAEMWMRISYLPLERDGDGWSVLAVGIDITEAHQLEQALRAQVTQQAALIDLATSLAGRRVGPSEATALLREPVARALSDTAGSLIIRYENELEQRSLADPGSVERMRLTPEAAERWAGGTHVNLDVKRTDIYGNQVTIERDVPIRSIVIAPVPNGDGDRIGSIGIPSVEPQAFTDADVEFIETAGRLVGPALDIAA